jgi:hypothetical protein
MKHIFLLKNTTRSILLAGLISGAASLAYAQTSGTGAGGAMAGQAQELAGQCAKAPGRNRAHQWDQVTRECRGLEVPEHRGHAARAEQLGQAGPVEQLGREALEGDQADTKLQYGTWDVISSVHIPIPG